MKRERLDYMCGVREVSGVRLLLGNRNIIRLFVVYKYVLSVN